MLNTTKHRFHLIKILESFYKNNEIASLLGFKAGTAAYLFYDLPRFSTDLDFDLIQLKDGDADSTAEIIKNIEGVLSKNYQIKESSSKFNTLFWLISYEKGEINIKIEINTRKYPNTYEVRNFYGNSIRLLQIGDMIAHKLVASMERKVPANRDLFDIDFFLKSKYASEINYNIINYRTGLNSKEFFQSLFKFIEDYDKKNILSGLGEVLTESQKHWVKDKLLIELRDLVQTQLAIYSVNSLETQSKDY